MAEEAREWTLWDFGTLQYLQCTITGELVKVHEDGAFGDQPDARLQVALGSLPPEYNDGPFKLDFDDSGKPVLIGHEGDDETCALHNGDAYVHTKLGLACRPGYVRMQRTLALLGDEPKELWLTDNINKFECKVLELPVEGEASFKSELYWSLVLV